VPERYEVVVNGERRAVAADGATPLLWVLRDELALTGTKYGCGEGLCGACTVLEGDVAVRSCQLTLAAAAGKRYTTIEGLSPDGASRCQTAWLDEQVSQCGYCQAGMILELESLLRRNPRPTRADLDAALDEHLCRCGSYPRLRRAAARAAGLGTAP
jgi:aerobic-type carbon monoxide dehydrogenase small subunit (CoxS/CutS family)